MKTKPAVGSGGRVRDANISDIYPQYNRPSQPTQKVKHGEVHGDVWRKVVYGSRHMLLKPRGWAVDVDDLEAALALGVVILELHDREANAVWRAALEDFRRHGVTIDRGYGQQVVLAVRYWRVIGRLTAKEVETLDSLRRGVQLRLFEF